MRDDIGADWAFGIKGAIENVVRKAFPADLRIWPLLQTFNFEAYSISDEYLVMVLRDKLSGIVSGPGVPRAFPHSDHPDLPPNPADAALWQAYLNRRFELRPEDAAIIVPIRDSGRSAPDDFKLFSQEEQALWDEQLRLIVSRQKARLVGAKHTEPAPPLHISYNVSGTNARVLINSRDESRYVVRSPTDIFDRIREAIATSIQESAREALMTAVQDMQEAHGTDRFVSKYQEFIAAAANHVTVFAPFLPALAQLL